MEKKQNSFVTTLNILLPCIVAIGIQLAVAGIAQFFAVLAISFRHLDLAQVASASGDIEAYMDAIMMDYTELILKSSFNDILTLAVMVVLAITFAIWFFKTEFPKKMSPLKKVFNIRNIIIIIISGVLVQIGISMLLSLILPLFPRILAQYESLMNQIVGGSTVLAVISAGILAPFAEEFIFRGLTLGGARKFWRFGLANTLQALLFGLYHMNLVQGVYAFLMGLAMGYIAYKLNNVFASVLFHASINCSSFLLEFIIPTAVYQSVLGMLAISIICIMTVIALLYLLKAPELPKAEAPAITIPKFLEPQTAPSAFQDDLLSKVDFTAPVQTPEIIGEIKPDAPENNSQEENK